jgi:hypothetical protein
VRQNRDSALGILIQKPQDKLVDQRRFSRAARPGEADDFRICDLRFEIRDFDTLRSALGVQLWRKLSIMIPTPTDAATAINYQYGAANTTRAFGFVSTVIPPMIGRVGIEFKF